MAAGEGKNRRQTTLGKEALDGRGVRIATGAERPRNDTFSRSAVGFFAVRRGGALPLPRAG